MISIIEHLRVNVWLYRIHSEVIYGIIGHWKYLSVTVGIQLLNCHVLSSQPFDLDEAIVVERLQPDEAHTNHQSRGLANLLHCVARTVAHDATEGHL